MAAVLWSSVSSSMRNAERVVKEMLVLLTTKKDQRTQGISKIRSALCLSPSGNKTFVMKRKSKENCEEVMDTLLTKWELSCDQLLYDIVRK